MSALTFLKNYKPDLVNLWFDDPDLTSDQNHYNKRFKLVCMLSTITAYDLSEQAEEIRLLISILDYQHNERTLQINENFQPVETSFQTDKTSLQIHEEPKTHLINAIQEYTDHFTTTYLKSLSFPVLADLLANQIKKKIVQDEIKAFEKEQGRQPRQKKTNSRFGGLSALSHPNYTVQDIEHIEIHGV